MTGYFTKKNDYIMLYQEGVVCFNLVTGEIDVIECFAMSSAVKTEKVTTGNEFYDFDDYED